MHELGHMLGRDHAADGVMLDTLAAGIQRTENTLSYTSSGRSC
jgi:hypothetical protein